MTRSPYQPNAVPAAKPLQFRLRSIIYAVALGCALTAAIVNRGTLGSAVASLAMAITFMYIGLQRSALLIGAGAAFLLLTAYHLGLFALRVLELPCANQ